MKLSDFDYHLPSDLIAQYPTANRGDSRLLYLDCPGPAITDHRFADIGALLNPGDLLVLNDTRVIPARLHGHKETGGQVEILLERLLSRTSFLAQIRASKPPRTGMQILIDATPALRVVSKNDDLYTLELLAATTVFEFLDQFGHVPLPPYIARADEGLDHERYQTVYARQPGAVAAPTAGLHFTETLLADLKAHEIKHTYVTLHVGAGTFQPVRVENIEQHKMHREYHEVPQSAVSEITATKRAGGRIIAVGTTSLRSLESAARSGQLEATAGETDLFIYPGFEFRVVDGLVTNFHLPRSSLLMLVSAFAGTEFIRAAYTHAVRERYRFFSYGDAMLILRS